MAVYPGNVLEIADEEGVYLARVKRLPRISDSVIEIRDGDERAPALLRNLGWSEIGIRSALWRDYDPKNPWQPYTRFDREDVL